MDLVLKLKRSHPNETKEQLFERFQKEVEADAALRRAVDWYYFANMASCLDVPRAPNKALDTSKEVKRVSSLIRNRVLMDVLLPSGKKLKVATFKECVDAGGWFAKIGGMGKPHQIVGAVLTEQDLPEPPHI